ncbi:MFS transporter [Paenarthrobacter histidinolovorans]|uniref:MFS family permease n=1 Tax=Paenarthrobacter histidinolovorans TaxID=43664 RepID=A0ABW8N785_9MICC
MSINTHSKRFKTALLSVSLLLSEAGAVSATLPELARAFPKESQASIQSFMTIGAAAIIVCTLLAGGLAGKIGKRRLTLIGIAIITVAGMGPLVFIPMENFGALLLSRLVVGAGMGLLQPLSSSVIADFFHGRDRENMLGWQSSAVGAGSVVWTLIVGAFMLWDWKAAFFVYAFGLVSLILVARYVPEPPKHALPDVPEAPQAKAPRWYRLSGDVWIAALLMLVFNIGFQTLFVAMPLAFVAEKHLIEPPAVSLIMTSFGMASVAAGIVFGFIMRRLGNWTGAVAAATVSLALIVCANASSAPLGYTAAIVAGLGFGTFMPFCITTTNNRATPETSAMATAILFTGAAIGTAITPYNFEAFGSFIGDRSATVQLVVGAVTVLAVAVLTGIRYGAMRHTAHTENKTLEQV